MMIEAPEACRPGSQHITHSFCIHSPSSPGCGITNTGVCASVRSLVTRYRVLLQPRCWCHKCRLMSPLSCSARRRDTPGMRGATWGAAQPPEPETRRLRHQWHCILSSYRRSCYPLITRPANCLITGLDRSLHLTSVSTSKIAKIYLCFLKTISKGTPIITIQWIGTNINGYM